MMCLTFFLRNMLEIDSNFLSEIKLQINTISNIKKLFSSLSNTDSTAATKLCLSATNLILESLKRVSQNRYTIFMIRSNQVRTF